MAITSEIIGKLGGGADVEVVPISGTNRGSPGTSVILHTVQVPAGESWLIVVIGDITPSSTSANYTPGIILGDVETRWSNAQDRLTVAGVYTGAVDVKLHRRYYSGIESFTGHVYTAKM